MEVVMKERRKRLNEVAENAVDQFIMPHWYRGTEPIQDIVNVSADLDSDEFLTFIYRLLETDYKVCYVWERNMYLLATKFRKSGMFHFERFCQEIDSLFRDQNVATTTVLARATRLQSTALLEMLETPSMYQYFSKLSALDALRMEKRDGK